MKSSTLRKTGLAAAAASALIALGMPLAFGAPTAAPPSDGEGYLNSFARCTKPDTAVLFGTTQSSRVAVCKTAAGAYEYRGVRVRDGAKLVAAAKKASDTTFAVDNDGVKYTITPTALSVTANGDTFRTETWTDYHGPKTSPSSAAAASSSPSASASATATAKPSTPAGSTASATPTAAPAAPSSAAPLPPPLAAEAGGGSASGE